MTSTVLLAGAGGLGGAAVVDRSLDDGWDTEESFRHRIRVLQERVLPPR